MGSRSFILPDERDIFLKVVNGDEAAFAVIFYHYTARISPFIQKMTRSEEATEEIVQDVFVSTWKNRAMLHQIESYQSWIFNIATNLTYNYLKSRARRTVRMEKFTPADDITYNTLESMDFKES